MHTLKVTLKQHTPLIHFQHDQEGATLRASEVKPKLDKFIYNKWLNQEQGNKENVFLKYGHLTVGYDDDKFKKTLAAFEKLDDSKKKTFLDNFRWALDYKMSFVSNQTNITIIRPHHENSPMYFGNMGENNEKKHFTKANFIEGKILTQHQQLITDIKNNLPDFFFTHNFGTRQSKGYGSFTVDKINNESVDFKFGAKYCFRIETNSWQDALFKTGLFYQSLRSGINIGRPMYSDVKGTNKNDAIKHAIKHQVLETAFYMKPIVFLYAKNEKQQWDKKTIKETYFNNSWYYRKASRKELQEYSPGNIFGLIETSGLKKQNRNSDVLNFSSEKTGSNYHFDYRDLFGLSSEEKWYSYGAEISKENEDINRYKSPIMFKPIQSDDGFCIFILLSEIDAGYVNQAFTIKSIEYKETNSSLKLQIPDKKNFVFDLFEFIVNHVNVDDCIKKKYRKYTKKGINYYDVLSDIYSQIKANLKCNTPQ